MLAADPGDCSWAGVVGGLQVGLVWEPLVAEPSSWSVEQGRKQPWSRPPRTHPRQRSHAHGELGGLAVEWGALGGCSWAGGGRNRILAEEEERRKARTVEGEVGRGRGHLPLTVGFGS